MEIKAPFNLNEWIENNRHLLKPPVGNKNLYIDSGDYIVMIVAGPNARKDYHYNETEELFYQIEGDIIVKTQQEGKLVEYKIKENEMFLKTAKKSFSILVNWKYSSYNNSLAVSENHINPCL